MKSNPILEEVWRIKDELAREANNDLHQLCENTRRWAADHPHDGPVVHSAEELQQFIAAKQQRRAGQPTLMLNEEPPKPTAKPPSAHEP
jgi:hypothetical protein